MPLKVQVLLKSLKTILKETIPQFLFKTTIHEHDPLIFDLEILIFRVKSAHLQLLV